MADNEKNADFPMAGRSLGPFRRAVLRGLGVLLPPLLTIGIFLWVGNTIADYVLNPVENRVRDVLVEHMTDVRNLKDMPADQLITKDDGTVVGGVSDGVRYHAIGSGKFIPESVYQAVSNNLDPDPVPDNAKEIYTLYVNQTWLQPTFVIPVFLGLFILALYLLGKFLAAGVGRFFWTQLERLIHRVPLVRNVYSSVKQVTDFLFTDPKMEYTRVVAVEYPRKGIWTLAFVTGESMLDIRSAANEPVLSIHVPTSPMPFTGFTVTVKKSETVDLNITVEQAFQFIVSCGVVVPPQQLADALAAKKKAPDGVERPLVLTARVAEDE
jgi:uncharacterized membrane protein